MRGICCRAKVDIVVPTTDVEAVFDVLNWPDSGAITWQIAFVVDAQRDGFTKTVNRGLVNTDAPYICIMSDDAVPGTEGWLVALYKALDGGYGFAFPTMPCRTTPISRARRESPTEQLVEIPHGPYGSVWM